MKTYDAIVLGVGGVGSSALFHLAQEGLSVLGIEQHGVAHELGSSHGETRVLRKAYFEHEAYVPLLERAYTLWDELEQESGESLKTLCGLFLAGREDSELISGIRESTQIHAIPIEELNLEDARRRFPGFRPDEDMRVLYEPEGGFLRVEECVRAHIHQAVKRGAEFVQDAEVLSWEADDHGVTVRTADETYSAAKLIVCAGPWSGRVTGIDLPIVVQRACAYWFDAGHSHYRLDEGAPVFGFAAPTGFFYGFPDIGGQGLKVAEHVGKEKLSNPGHWDKSLREDELATIRSLLERYLPNANTTLRHHAACMYSMTPDGHFIIDTHPEHEHVLLLAGFSGHGFKFTSVLGEASARFALNGKIDSALDFLSLKRFSEG